MSKQPVIHSAAEWVVSWKGLQWAAVLAYGMLFGMLLWFGLVEKHWSPTVFLTGFSLVVMVGRLRWTMHKGFWGSKYSSVVKKKNLTLWSPAFVPERTAVVPLVIILYLSIMRPEPDGVVATIFGLLVTGGLFAAVITSPHSLIELAGTLDAEQKRWDRRRRASGWSR